MKKEEFQTILFSMLYKGKYLRSSYIEAVATLNNATSNFYCFTLLVITLRHQKIFGR